MKDKIKVLMKQLDSFIDAHFESDIRLTIKDYKVNLYVYKTKNKQTKEIKDIDLDLFNELLATYLQNSKNKVFTFMIETLKQRVEGIKKEAIEELNKELKDLNNI